MPSLIYNSFEDDVHKGNMNPQTDNFKVMFVTSAYVENKDTHLKRSDVTNEVAAGGGYVAGGFAVDVSVTKDLVNDRVEVTLPGIVVPNSTITARKAVYYKARGGAANLDELVAVVDFNGDVASVNSAFTLQASTIRLQN